MSGLKFQITSTAAVHPEALLHGLRQFFHEAPAVLETAVRRGTPVGVGGESGLRGSVFSEVRETASLFESITSSNLPYALPVEFGRRAGAAMPPSKALVPWVQAKIPLRRGQTAEGVAFVIARAIAKRGTRAWRQNPSGERMFERGLLTSRDTLLRIAEERLRGAAPQLIVTEAWRSR